MDEEIFVLSGKEETDEVMNVFSLCSTVFYLEFIVEGVNLPFWWTRGLESHLK